MSKLRYTSVSTTTTTTDKVPQTKHESFNKHSSMFCVRTESNSVRNWKDICYKLQTSDFDDVKSVLHSGFAFLVCRELLRASSS